MGSDNLPGRGSQWPASARRLRPVTRGCSPPQSAALPTVKEKSAPTPTTKSSPTARDAGPEPERSPSGAARGPSWDGPSTENQSWSGYAVAIQPRSPPATLVQNEPIPATPTRCHPGGAVRGEPQLGLPGSRPGDRDG